MLSSRSPGPGHAGRLLLAAALALAACSSGPPAMPPPLPTPVQARAAAGDEQVGARLLRDRGFGRSGLACADCHALPGQTPAPRRPGPPLAGVAQRDALWQGLAVDLAGAVNLCVERYQTTPARGGAPLADLLAGLAGPGPAAPPRTFAAEIPPLGAGNPTRGLGLYAEACRPCHEHGPAGGLAGRPLTSGAVAAAILGLDRPPHPGTLMPPFPLEVLGAEDVADVVAAVVDAPDGLSGADWRPTGADATVGPEFRPPR